MRYALSLQDNGSEPYEYRFALFSLMMICDLPFLISVISLFHSGGAKINKIFLDQNFFKKYGYILF